MIKYLLALLVVAAVDYTAFDRINEANALRYHSPEVRMCQFNPLRTYGVKLNMKGFYENAGCCTWKGKSCNGIMQR